MKIVSACSIFACRNIREYLRRVRPDGTSASGSSGNWGAGSASWPVWSGGLDWGNRGAGGASWADGSAGGADDGGGAVGPVAPVGGRSTGPGSGDGADDRGWQEREPGRGSGGSVAWAGSGRAGAHWRNRGARGHGRGPVTPGHLRAGRGAHWRDGGARGRGPVTPSWVVAGRGADGRDRLAAGGRGPVTPGLGAVGVRGASWLVWAVGDGRAAGGDGHIVGDGDRVGLGRNSGNKAGGDGDGGTHFGVVGFVVWVRITGNRKL